MTRTREQNLALITTVRILDQLRRGNDLPGPVAVETNYAGNGVHVTLYRADAAAWTRALNLAPEASARLAQSSLNGPAVGSDVFCTVHVHLRAGAVAR